MTVMQQYNDLMNQLSEVNKEYDAMVCDGNYEGARALTEKINNLNENLATVKVSVDREEAKAMQNAPVMNNEVKDMLEDRAERLRRGDSITFTAEEIKLALFRNSVTIGGGVFAEPTKAGTTIHDAIGGVSSIIEQVTVNDYAGCGSVLEPVLMAEQAAQPGKVSTKAGTARTATDPTFATAKIVPYEVSVTTYVDRNLSRISPVSYEAKIRELAMRALRREVTKLIYNGDGQSTPEMYGVKTGKTTAGSALFKSVSTGGVAAGFLDKLVYAYGGSEEVGPNARLFLNKADLQAIGALRSTDGKRIYEIIPDAGNPNTGRIVDGGLVVPYTVGSALTALSAQTTGTTATMVYGDPANYILGLFGDYSIRIDESYKAGERLNTVLGDVFVGGNIAAKDGFVVATL